MLLAVRSLILYDFCVFFFKQKTAYEMRISDWSSDVCSSDLPGGRGEQHRGLAFDHAQVGGFVHVRIAHVQKLQHLALGDAVGGVGEDPLHVHRVEFDHQLEAARIQEVRSEEHTSELQSLMRNSYAVFCLIKNKKNIKCT